MLSKTNGHYCNNFFMYITIFRSSRLSFDKTISMFFCCSITIACDMADESESNKERLIFILSHEQISFTILKMFHKH